MAGVILVFIVLVMWVSFVASEANHRQSTRRKTSPVRPTQTKPLALSGKSSEQKYKQYQVESLTIRLAVTLCVATGRLTKQTVVVINKWINTRVAVALDKTVAQNVLSRALKDALDECEAANGIEVGDLCKQIAEIATALQRYNVVRLCLLVASGDTLNKSHTDMLSRVADSLGVDTDKFRAMVQKILPLDLYETIDLEFVLGITEDMSHQQICRQLNDQYRKWNARVTHRSSTIQTQADRILALIAQTRDDYNKRLPPPQQARTA